MMPAKARGPGIASLPRETLTGDTDCTVSRGGVVFGSVTHIGWRYRVVRRAEPGLELLRFLARGHTCPRAFVATHGIAQTCMRSAAQPCQCAGRDARAAFDGSTWG